ncbi:MAG: hypothetical protein ACR2MS_09760 [Weeksellaceae bacterium]
MNPSDNKHPNQEVDLLFIWRAILQFFDDLGLFIVRFIRFLIRKIFIILGILVLGSVIGYFLDEMRGDIYKHEIILAPNFGSTAYLYEKVASQQDSFDSIILSVEIEPIVDVYGMLSASSSNLEIGQFLSENNVNISEHKPGNQTEKIYRYHKLTILTDRKDQKGKIVDGYLSDLNNEPYFLRRQQIEKKNTIKEIEESNISIQNINALFNKLANAEGLNKGNLNIEMYPEINGLIGSKNGLINNIKERRISQLEMDKVFFDIVKIQNVKVDRPKLIYILPIALFLLFLLSSFFLNRYKRISVKMH